MNFKFRKLGLSDIKEVYKMLVANRPYVGLNSMYTYFLLARDFSDTCLVALCNGKIVGFSSGYMSPNRPDTFFSWEIVVQKDYRGNGLQLRMLREQIRMKHAKYFECTVNPSNEAAKNNIFKLAQALNSKCEEKVLFSREDFENDSHEAEVLYRIGSIEHEKIR